MQSAIDLLEEAARTDLEQCEAAIHADDKARALETLERAFAKIDTALDLIRTYSRP